ncbi:hypothetical protein CR513_44068, partial [Mucuna pruriens]
MALWAFPHHCGTLCWRKKKAEGHIGVGATGGQEYTLEDIVENGDYIPQQEDETDLPRSLWNEEQKMMYLLNSKTRNFMMCALTEVEYEKVYNYESSKEMWDTLTFAYEGTC